MPLAMLSAMALLSACGKGVSDRPCPRVSEFPEELQRQAVAELTAPPPKPAIGRMLDAMAVDRAFNRRVCAP